MRVTMEKPNKRVLEIQNQKLSAKKEKCDTFPWTKLVRSGQGGDKRK
jgi:hypothetical protein